MAGRNARVESTSVSHEKISLMLHTWKSVKAPHALLIGMSCSAFRQWFSRGFQATGLDGGYKPNSLRRGGATQVFLDTRSYASVCQRGPWASERTSRITSKISSHFLRSNLHNSLQNNESFILFGQTFGAGLSFPAKLEETGAVLFGFLLGFGAETREDRRTSCS